MSLYPSVGAIATAIFLLSGMRPAVADETITPIELAHGYGVTINFTLVNETVTTIWVDNPSFFTLTTNGCLSGLAEKDCETEGASLVHLRRIQDLNLPNLPRTNSTLMTVVTASSTGLSVYLFEIKKADRVSSVHLIIDIVE